MAVIKIVPMPGPSGNNGGISSTVPFELNDTNDDLLLSITKTGTGTTRIETPQDDLSLRSARDITLFAGSDGPGNVYVGWGDAVYTPDSPNRVATIGDIESVHGDITFDGVQVIGGGTGSGDGLNNGTIELVPDIDLETDQYLIIDPTAPNHIHIRAGGTQDDSQAELILGGERNQVAVSDMSRNVRIITAFAENINSYINENLVSNEIFVTTAPAVIDVGYKVNVSGTEYTVTSVQNDAPTPGKITVTVPGATFNSLESYTFVGDDGNNNYWYFGNDGVLSGPAMGGLIVNSIVGPQNQNLTLYPNINQDVSLYNASVSDMPVGYRYPAILDGLSDTLPVDAELTHIGRTLWNNYTEWGMPYIIPTDTTLNFPLGTEIKFACGSISAFYITSEDNDIVTMVGTGPNYDYTLLDGNYFIILPNSTATIQKVAPNHWILSGMKITD